LLYGTRDAEGQPSQAFRTLFLQELIRRGVLAPSFIVSYSHGDDAIDRTIDAVDGALAVYRKALDEGVDRYLVGPAVKPVYRRVN
jgi:glutamate-1-semialdehyde 2,1-aminomutase